MGRVDPLANISKQELQDFQGYSVDLFETSDNRIFNAKTIDASEYAMQRSTK